MSQGSVQVSGGGGGGGLREGGGSAEVYNCMIRVFKIYPSKDL